MPRSIGTVAALALAVVALGTAGCGPKPPPPVYAVTGKVTLGGKAYERLIVYFRPASSEVNEFNLGVGETDKDGNLTMRSSGGMGVMAGEYKVTFTLRMMKTQQGTRSVGSDEKPSETGTTGTAVELVPEAYRAGKAEETTTVRCTVQANPDNRFDFDVPAK